MSSKDPSFKTFRYLVAENAGLYRAIMRAFVEARERYQLHLRPGEVETALASDGLARDGDLEGCLTQLCEWGNLDKHTDTSEVRTVEEFNRPRYLYSLTPEGAAVEQAVAYFDELLSQQGRLDTVALRDVQEHLQELEQLLHSDAADPGRARRVFEELIQRFDRLTTEAQKFLQGLLRSIELQTMELQAFLAYKEKLIDYLEHFLHELVITTSEISEILQRIDETKIRGVIDDVVEQEVASQFNPDADELQRLRDRWTGRWEGLCCWFIDPEHGTCQAAQLRARARSAIPAFLEAVSSINERRASRSDRTADYHALAHWFLEAESDAEAHRLWRGAFGLSPSRHLRIDAETLQQRNQEPVSPRTSWLEAPPLRISPRLRRTGRHTRKGPTAAVVDRREQQRKLRELAEKQAREIEAARSQLITDGTTRLSEIATLDPAAFRLLLDLLGHALARKRRADGPVKASSTDGSLMIHMQPTGDGATATIQTSWGVLTGGDHFVTIEDAMTAKTVGSRG